MASETDLPLNSTQDSIFTGMFSDDDAQELTRVLSSVEFHIDLEGEYSEKLIDVIKKQTQNSVPKQKKILKRAKEILLNPNHSLTLNGEDLTAKVFDPKRNEFFTVNSIFPLFDDFYQYSKCTCKEKKNLLDEFHCEHILAAHELICSKLSKSLVTSEEEKKDFTTLLRAVKNLSSQQATSVELPPELSTSDDSSKEHLFWYLSTSFELSPFLKEAEGTCTKLFPEDVGRLHVDTVSSKEDWMLLTKFIDLDKGIPLQSLEDIHLLESLEHVSLDQTGNSILRFEQAKIELDISKPQPPEYDDFTTSEPVSPTIQLRIGDVPLKNQIHFLKDGTLTAVSQSNSKESGGPQCHTVWYCPLTGAERQLLDILSTSTPSLSVQEKMIFLDEILKENHPFTIVSHDNSLGELEIENKDSIKQILRFQPVRNGGYRIDLLVRVGKFLSYPPGLGPQDIIDKNEQGQLIRNHRDFDAEVFLAGELIEKTPLHKFASATDHNFYAQNDEQVLSFIETLQKSELSKRVDLDWPKNFGKPLELESPPQPEDLKITVKTGSENENSGLFDLNIEVEIGDMTLKFIDLIQRIKQERRFTQLPSGKWMKITEALRKKIKDLEKAISPIEKELNLASTGLKPSEVNGAHELATCEASLILLNELVEKSENISLYHQSKRIKSTLERFSRLKSQNPASVPTTLKANLRSYQLEGFQWLSRNYELGLGCILADDMGLGKTLQTIALLTKFKDSGPHLIVCPKSLIPNWISEIKKFSPELDVKDYATFRSTPDNNLASFFRVQKRRGKDLDKYAGRNLQKNQQKNQQKGQVMIVSYGIMCSDIELLSAHRWNTVVFDEAQAFKTPTTRNNRCARRLDADFKLALSGTPIENHLGELWAIFRVVSKGLLGSFKTFRKRFILPITIGNSSQSIDTLKKMIAPFVLRRLKKDVLKELPDKLTVKKVIELSEEERFFYDAARIEAASEIERKRANLSSKLSTEIPPDKLERKLSSRLRVDVLAALSRLRQVAIDPRLIVPDWEGPTSKTNVAIELVITCVQNGEKVLVFSSFTSQLKLFRGELNRLSIESLYLDGGTSTDERRILVDRFQSGSEKVFLISLKAGGTGLNLTAATSVVHLDPWWNPAAEDQASDRAYRMGQTKNVTIYKLITADTVEEKISELHAKKKQLSASVLSKEAFESLNSREIIDLL